MEYDEPISYSDLQRRCTPKLAFPDISHVVEQEPMIKETEGVSGYVLAPYSDRDRKVEQGIRFS